MQTSACRPDTMDNMASYPDWLESCLSVEPKSGDNDVISDVDGETTSQTAEDCKGTYTRLRSASKPHSTPQTLKWLEENYEIAEGVCIPRSTLYVHYLDYCEKHDTQPVNAASFGKIIRQQFPQLTTRRLGTRGQSKYHYYGIGVRETSEYYEFGFSAKGAQSASDGKKDSSKQIIAYSPRSKLGTLLPDFPDIKDIKLPPDVEEEKVLTFLMMYRTHCQRILDTVIRANFDEVQSFLLHFWQGMPTHIKTILESQVLVMLVGVCDSILYKAIANVLMPTVLQPLPDSLTQVIRHFSMQLDDWLRRALNSLPKCLQRVKFNLARSFAQVLKRQTSLNHLCQAARTVINSADITAQMLDDWFNIDLNSIIKQTLYTADRNSDQDNINIVKLARDFEILLEDQAPMESYIEWLDGMVEQCVVQTSTQTFKGLKTTARHFLLMWSCVGTRIIRDMTLHSAPSFGSFHLLHLMFDEYVMYVVENLHNQEKAGELLKAIKGEISSHFVESLLTSAAPSEDCEGPLRDVRLNPEMERGSVIKGPCAEMTLHDQLTGSSNTNYFGPAETDFMSHTTYKTNGFSASSHCISNSPVMSTAYSPRSNMATLPCQAGNSGVKPGYMTCNEHNPNAYNNNDWPQSSFPGMPSEKIDYEQVSCYKNTGGFMENVPSNHPGIQCFETGYKRHLPTGHVSERGTYPDAVDMGRSSMPEVYPYHVTNLT